MTSPLRYTKQLAADNWVTKCCICPKRYGRRFGRTEQAVDLWWAEHEASEVHQGFLSRDGRLTETEEQQENLLVSIFGMKKSASPSVRPSQRSGERFVRPNARKVQESDPTATEDVKSLVRIYPDNEEHWMYSVSCIQCGAEAWQPCVSKLGRRTTYLHRPRTDEAFAPCADPLCNRRMGHTGEHWEASSEEEEI